jgi:hypothetical protein
MANGGTVSMGHAAGDAVDALNDILARCSERPTAGDTSGR